MKGNDKTINIYQQPVVITVVKGTEFVTIKRGDHKAMKDRA